MTLLSDRALERGPCAGIYLGISDRVLMTFHPMAQEILLRLFSDEKTKLPLCSHLQIAALKIKPRIM